jgi:hypothetical protein
MAIKINKAGCSLTSISDELSKVLVGLTTSQMTFERA